VWGDAGPLEPAVAAAGRLEPHSGPEPPGGRGESAPVVEGEPYRLDLPPPEDFVAVIDNPYMPFIPGTRTVFEACRTASASATSSSSPIA
jgi:hypothetical protein